MMIYPKKILIIVLWIFNTVFKNILFTTHCKCHVVCLYFVISITKVTNLILLFPPQNSTHWLCLLLVTMYIYTRMLSRYLFHYLHNDSAPIPTLEKFLWKHHQCLTDATKSAGHAAFCKFPTTKASAGSTSAWKKISGPNTHLMDIVNRSRYDQKPGKVQVRTREDDFKMRRRKLYRLMSEEKPKFPLQQKNFYSYVMENKEVVKMLSLLSTCMQDMKPVS